MRPSLQTLISFHRKIPFLQPVLPGVTRLSRAPRPLPACWSQHRWYKPLTLRPKPPLREPCTRTCRARAYLLECGSERSRRDSVDVVLRATAQAASSIASCSGKIINRGWGVKEHVDGSNQDKRIRETGQNCKDGRCDKLIQADRACGTAQAQGST